MVSLELTLWKKVLEATWSPPTLTFYSFCDTGHPDPRLPTRPWLPYLVMVVARQQEQQRQGQGNVGPLRNVLLG